MDNQLNSGRLDTLKLGQTLLLSARKVRNGKLQLEFAEVLTVSEGPKTALSRFNRSDSRFGSRARRAWVITEMSDISADLGVDFSDNNEGWEMTPKGEVLELNMLNPVVDGERIRIMVSETVTPNEYQAENIETSAKRRGKGGDFILHDGEYIFSNTLVVITNETITHTLLEADATEVKSVKQQTVESTATVDEFGL